MSYTKLNQVNPKEIQKIAFINFGGIGDEILFAPVIAEVRKYLPHAHTTLFLEERSRAVSDLLPDVDCIEPIEVQKTSKAKLFFQLSAALKRKHFDLVISSGSSPFIPLMLFSSGVRYRVGFRTGWTSRNFLTVEAPLNQKQYAADMYFSLASTFLKELIGETYQPPSHVVPVLKELSNADQVWAASLMPFDPRTKRAILVHPGVSLVSVEKGILKGWSAAKWADLIVRLSEQGDRIFLVGGPDDAQIMDAIIEEIPESTPNIHNLYGKTRNLMQLAALIRQADLLVSVDSSPLHIAVGLNKPVVVMFGPTDENKLIPEAPRFKAVVDAGLQCRPCLWDVRQISCEQPVCLNVTIEAMLEQLEQAIHA